MFVRVPYPTPFSLFFSGSGADLCFAFPSGLPLFQAQGVTFGSVHDSFWTHAATVPMLNSMLREQFVELHSAEPSLLKRLLEQVGPELSSSSRRDRLQP